MKNIYQKACYLYSVVELKNLPADEGLEVAFIGRSNAGKSSAINTITGIKNLARTSRTPGRTQMINFFSLDDNRRIVDLPGYGYAKVPRVVQGRWEKNVNEYLQIRECLKGLVLVMDIRHPLKELDVTLIQWATECRVPIHILLTKADKLTPAAGRKVVKEVEEALKPYENAVTVQAFSSLDRGGLDLAIQRLNQWFADC
jgi:GTP-binding protein